MELRGLAAVVAVVVLWPVGVLAQPPHQPQPPQQPPPMTPSPPGQPAQPGQPLGPPPEPEPSLLDYSWLLVAGGLSVGAPTDETLDDVLRTRGYADAPRVWGGDATVLFRVLDWLWLGGRIDLRARDWARTGQASANAVGAAVMALAEARLRLNRAVDLGLAVGLGVGVVAFSMNDVTEAYPSPRAHIGVPLGFTIGEPARMFVRVGWDYLRGTNINDFGHDVSLTGASLTLGMEVRR